MTATRMLAATGTVTTVLAGGLFLGVPAALAVPVGAPPGTPPGVATPADTGGGAGAEPAVPLEAPVPEAAVQQVAPLEQGPLPEEALQQVAPPEVVPQTAGNEGNNAGLNVDTFLTAAPSQQPAGAGVLTALLAAAVVLPGALALRARRLGHDRA